MKPPAFIRSEGFKPKSPLTGSRGSVLIHGRVLIYRKLPLLQISLERKSVHAVFILELFRNFSF
jgi:hypothetical protein